MTRKSAYSRIVSFRMASLCAAAALLAGAA